MALVYTLFRQRMGEGERAGAGQEDARCPVAPKTLSWSKLPTDLSIVSEL
jgi:hypothetical protein